MDIKDWELIKALKGCGTAVKAAEKLFLSQPAVTYRLKKMESEVGTKLFIKSNKGILFTSAGDRLFSYADKMLRQYRDALEAVKRRDGMVSGSIYMGAPPYFASRYLPSLFKDFSGIYPEIALHLSSGLSSDLMELLRREEILLAVIRGGHAWNGDATVILQEPVNIVAAKPLTLEELPRTPYISYRTDPYLQEQIDHWWGNNFSSPRNTLINTYGSFSCIRFIKEGLGFSLLPGMSLGDDETLFRQTITNSAGEPYMRSTRLLYHSKVRNFDAYTAFIDFFIKKMTVAQTPRMPASPSAPPKSGRTQGN